MKIIKTATAWESIGFDEGKFRIKGGRALYEAVMYNCANSAQLVKLARLDVVRVGNQNRIKEVSRYVKPDTILEFVEPEEKTDSHGYFRLSDEKLAELSSRFDADSWNNTKEPDDRTRGM